MPVSSREEAEQAYRARRAELELVLNWELKEAREEAHSGQNRKDWEFQGVTRDIAVTGCLFAPFSNYLQAEVENFSALLVMRDLRGIDGCDALREHFAGLLKTLSERWQAEIELAMIDPATPGATWSRTGSLRLHYLEAFEKFFLEMEAPGEEPMWPGIIPLNEWEGEPEQLWLDTWYFGLQLPSPHDDRQIGYVYHYDVSDTQSQDELAGNGSADPPIDEVIRQRAALLEEYKNDTGNPSNKLIYEAHNSQIHKPEFYAWLKGELKATSATCMNFERFLRSKQPPVRKPRAA